MNPILVLRQAACQGLAQIDEPSIRAILASLIVKCDEVLEKVA